MNDWQQESLGPSVSVSAPPTPPRYTSPPLLRMFGGIAFIGTGIAIWFGAARLFGIEWTQPKWNAATIAVYVGSMVAALIAGLIGGTIAMTIPVRSRAMNFFISVTWQYMANGTAIWIMLLLMVTQKAIGRAGMQALVRSGGSGRIGLLTMAVGA